MSPLLGGLLGAAAGLGLAMVAARLLATRRPSLESRVAPYIRDVPTVSVSWSPLTPSSSPSSTLVALVRPTMERSAERLERVLGGRASIERRLQRAGLDQSVETFRFSQVVWGLGGFGIGLTVGALGPAREPGRALPWLLVCCGCALVAILARDSALTRTVKAREDRILAEFPVVADLLALSVAAGEGPVAALDRVVSTCRGALPAELAAVLAQSRTGVPMTVALDEMAQRSGLAIVSRFAEGFAVALERGTPLVDVLTAQAADVREAAKRALIETGARKEIAMMVPVVFLIMPVTLLFTISILRLVDTTFRYEYNRHVRPPNWDANETMNGIVGYADVGQDPLVGIEMHGSTDDLDRDLIPGWIAALAAAETNIRLLRRRLESELTGTRTCPVCDSPVVGRAGRVYCSGACRQAAYRRGRDDVGRLRHVDRTGLEGQSD